MIDPVNKQTILALIDQIIFLQREIRSECRVCIDIFDADEIKLMTNTTENKIEKIKSIIEAS